MLGSCRHCAHWMSPEELIAREGCEGRRYARDRKYGKAGFGSCTELFGVSGEPNDPHGIAFAAAYGCNNAALLTKPEFGCSQFEEDKDG